METHAMAKDWQPRWTKWRLFLCLIGMHALKPLGGHGMTCVYCDRFVEG